jgi:tight adherence protein C
MTGQVLAIAAIAAVAAGCLVRAVLRTPARLGPRLAPYTERARGRLGTAVPQRAAGARSVWGPMVTAAADRLSKVMDTGTSGEVELRLRRAGLADMSAARYRRRQLAWTVGGFAVGVAVAVLLQLSTTAALIVAGAFGAAGALRWRAKVDGLIDDRRTVMRAEAHTVCQMLAVWLRTGDTPSGALERLTRRATGIVPAELAEAAAQIRSGAPPVEVLERLAAQTAEPSAGRLYRLYGASWAAGGDPTALLALSDSLRASRRDALARTMARRRVAMALPLVAVIAPILILFIAAAIPSIVFGR